MIKKTQNILIEVAKILCGEHKAWRGDRILNAEAYLRRISKNSDEAREIANDIKNNILNCSEVSGLHPDRCRWIANILN